MVGARIGAATDPVGTMSPSSYLKRADSEFGIYGVDFPPTDSKIPDLVDLELCGASLKQLKFCANSAPLVLGDFSP